jgi:hypothetical protein
MACQRVAGTLADLVAGAAFRAGRHYRDKRPTKEIVAGHAPCKELNA